jgi:hypothetical protein
MLFRYKDFAIFELLRVGSGDAEAFARHVLRSLAGADGNPAILRRRQEADFRCEDPGGQGQLAAHAGETRSRP